MGSRAVLTGVAARERYARASHLDIAVCTGAVADGGMSGIACPKPAKGSALIERKQRRKAIEAQEDREKQIVRRRDRVCRWPHCENCRRFKPRLEVAHLTAKGAGGDHGHRSSADAMILLDLLTHQGGPSSLEQHGRRIEPLTSAGTSGPCEFWLKDENGDWSLMARERSINVLERD